MIVMLSTMNENDPSSPKLSRKGSWISRGHLTGKQEIQRNDNNSRSSPFYAFKLDIFEN
jgi:hypothetical protein